MGKRQGAVKRPKHHGKATGAIAARDAGARSRHAALLQKLYEQFRSLLGFLFLMGGIGCAGILVTFLLSHATGIPFSYLSRDMAATLHVKEAMGFLSNVGIMLWSSTAAVCIFSAFVLRKSTGSRRAVSFFMVSGLLTFWLALDDLFLFHDQVFPFYVGIPEKLIYGSYVCITVGYLISFRKEILATDYLPLLMAGFFLGMSMSMDNILAFSEVETILEDSLKFLGITFWFGYFFRASLMTARAEMNH